MNMALFWQAALVGIFGYLGAVDSIVMGGVAYGFYILGRPLIAGFICGLIFGDVKAGVLCGLAVQAVFIATSILVELQVRKSLMLHMVALV